MSAFVKVDVQFEDQEHILAALAACGFGADKVEVHEEAQALVGYQGDPRKQKANIIIRRKHIGSASNDVGFIKNEDGRYSLYVSAYDQTAFPHRLKQPDMKAVLGELKAQYAIARTTAKAKAMGGSVTTTKQGKKTVLTVSVYR